MDLNYGEAYDIIIAKRLYKGIYLGQKNVRGKFSLNHLILVNYLLHEKKENFAIFRFKDFKFENNRLFLGYHYNIPIPENQKVFYDNLLEEKLKKDFIRVFEKLKE